MNGKFGTRLSAFLLAALLMLTAAGCGAQEAPKEQPAKTETAVEAEPAPEAEPVPATEAEPEAAPVSDGHVETLRLMGGNDGTGPNPFRRTLRGGGHQKVNLIYDSLMESGENDFIPWLADSYEADGMTYTFHLNPNAMWHDGQPVTADDVVFTANYYRDHTPTGYALGTPDNYLIASAEAPDDLTVVLTVSHQDSGTFKAITDFPILPRHVWETVEDPKTYDGEGMYVGCGMYKLISYDGTTGAYEFEAMDNYYRGRQGADRILFVPVSDELLAFDNHELDLASVPLDLLEHYEQDPNIGILETPNNMIYRLHLNIERNPEFADVEMRKALYQALDREKMLNDIFRGAGCVASAGECPPTSPWYTDEVVKYPRDVEFAKSMLDGKGIELDLYCSDNPNYVKMAEIIKMNLAECGVTVNVIAQDGNTTDAVSQTGEYDLLIMGSGNSGLEPYQVPRTLTIGAEGHGPSTGCLGWEDAEIEQLCDDIKAELDPEKQKELYQELQVAASEQIPYFPLVNSSNFNVYRKDGYTLWKMAFNWQQFTHRRMSYMTGDFS